MAGERTPGPAVLRDFVIQRSYRDRLTLPSLLGVTFVVLCLIVLFMGAAWWLAVHYTPPVISFVLPGRPLQEIGAFVLALGLIGAFLSSYVLRSPESFVESLVHVFVGGWLMLAPSSAQRGAEEHERLLQHVGIALLSGVVVGLVLLYASASPQFWMLSLWLMLFTAVVAMRVVRQGARRQ